MNWKLIFGLSLFGLAMALATISVIPEGITESFFWLPIFIICAVIIARVAPGKYFLHGFLVSLVNCVWITGAHITWSDTYVLHHANEVAMNAKMNMPVKQAMLIMGPVIGIVSGLVLGLFAFIASKLVKKHGS